jgi:hypothetical protein
MNEVLEAAKKLTVTQLQSELKKTWQRYSAVKAEMSPLLYELRRKLRAQGKKGEGWAAWVEAGHIGISLKTANRWADEIAGEKGTSSRKSRGGLKARAAETPVWKFSAPTTAWFTSERQRELNEAIQIVGDNRAAQLIYEAITAEVERRNGGFSPAIGGTQNETFHAHA